MKPFTCFVWIRVLLVAPSPSAAAVVTRGREGDVNGALPKHEVQPAGEVAIVPLPLPLLDNRRSLRSSAPNFGQGTSLSEVAAAVATVTAIPKNIDVPLAECLKKYGEKCYRDQKVWGPPTWFFLHSMTMALPEKVPSAQQEKLRELIHALPGVLPCPMCGKNLGEHLRSHPVEPHLASRDALVEWMIDIHNSVNKEIGKRELSKDEVIQKYNEAFEADSAALLIPAGSGKHSAANPHPTLSSAVTVTFVAFVLGLSL